MVKCNKLTVALILVFFLFTGNLAFAAPTNTMSITPSAASGTTITASDENGRNSSITSTFNAHSHTDITAMSGVNSFTIGDGAAGTKSYLVDDSQTSSPGLRYATTTNYWEMSFDGSTWLAIGQSSGVVIAGENTFRVGDGTNTGNKDFIANTANAAATDPRLRYNVSSSVWQFSNDGSTFSSIGVASGSVVSGVNEFNIGDGTTTGHKILYANTGASQKPAIRYNVGSSVWQFANNGQNYTSLAAGPVDQGCRVRNSANQSIANTTLTSVTFDTEDYDPLDMHSTNVNTSRVTFTAVTAGKYIVGGNVRWASNTTGERRVVLQLNGGTELGTWRVTSSNGIVEESVTTEYNFVNGDYVELAISQDSGGALNSITASSSNPSLFVRRTDA